MTIRELIRALEIYDSEKEVKLNDFHKGLDDIGVIKEVAEGHVEITRMGYGKEYFEKPLPTDEQIEANGIEGGLRDGELQMFWEGAVWMRNLIKREEAE